MGLIKGADKIEAPVAARNPGLSPSPKKKEMPKGGQNFSYLVCVLKQSLDGDAITSMVVCLSQASDNGGETYFSTQYGEKFNKLSEQAIDFMCKGLEKVRKYRYTLDDLLCHPWLHAIYVKDE